MIVELIVKMIAGLFRGVASLFGSLSMPGWWDDLDGWLDQLSGFAAGFGSWIPWGIAIGAATFVMGCIVLAFGIKVVRMVVSVFTGGGGSAA